MSERVKTVIIAVVGFVSVSLVMCLIGGVLAKADKTEKESVNTEAVSTADAAEQEDAEPGESADEGGDPDTKAPEGKDAASDQGPSDANDGSEGETQTPDDDADDPEGENEAEGEDENPGDKPANGIKIAIDAGHQKKANSETEPIGPGSDKTRAKVTWGTEGVQTHIPEYELTLAVAEKIRDELESRGYEVVMIREDSDVNIPDSQRALTANTSGAKAVLHIHGNADDRPEIKGIMAFVPSKDNPFSGAYHDESASFAEKILSSMETELSAKNWGVIDNDTLSTLNYTKIPAVHLEVGYMTNKDEDALLADDEYRTRIAKAVADGIDEYFSGNTD